MHTLKYHSNCKQSRNFFRTSVAMVSPATADIDDETGIVTVTASESDIEPINGIAATFELTRV